MSQGYTRLGIVSNVDVAYQDGPSLDAFSRLRVSTPSYVFDGQLTYDLQPLLFAQMTSNGGGGTATIAHDATNRDALMTFSAALTGAYAYMQTYEYFRYQPGRSQLIFCTFNFIETAANVLKFAGYCDGLNGVRLEQNGSTVQLKLYSDTTSGDETVAKASWNIDPMDGTGPSGVTLDLTKTQILVIDFQALYVGRIRVGFDIGGVLYYVHEFLCANESAHPYAQTMNLPVQCGMIASDTVSTTMNFICASVISEGGDERSGYTFAVSSALTSAGSERTHALTVKPKTTFNGLQNRSEFVLESIEGVVTGNTSVLWELCVGQGVTGGTFMDVNTTYSGFLYNPSAAATGAPPVVIASGYVAASAQGKTSVGRNLAVRYPITLGVSGAERSMGSLSVMVTSLGAASACQFALNWREVR